MEKELWRDKADLIGLKSRPLRVVMIGDTFIPVVDGVVRVMENYIEQFQNKNVEFLIIAPAYKDYDLQNDERLSYKPLRVKCSIIKIGSYQVFKTPLGSKDLEVIDKFNPDIIHIHSPFFAGLIGIQLKKRYNIPLVLTLNTNFKQLVKQTTNDFVGQLSGMFINKLVKNADTIIHLSRTDLKHSGLDNLSARNIILNTGTKLSYPENPDKIRQIAVDLYNIDQNKNNLLYVGKFVWEKNIKLLLDCYKKLLQRSDKYTLTMVGGLNNEQEIMTYATKIGIYDKIKFTGVINNQQLLQGLYLSHDLLVFPSIFDTFSLVVHEAASQGLASLVVKNSSSSENIIDDRNGFICEEDSQSFCNKIEEIFANKKWLKVVGQYARSLPYSWDEVVENTIDEYMYTIRKYYDVFRLARLKKLSAKVHSKFVKKI